MYICTCNFKKIGFFSENLLYYALSPGWPWAAVGRQKVACQYTVAVGSQHAGCPIINARSAVASQMNVSSNNYETPCILQLITQLITGPWPILSFFNA